MRRALLILVLLLPAAAEAAPESVRVETEHYVLIAESPGEDAEELAAVLEAAWPEYREFFDAEPELAEDERLEVVFCETKEGFVEALRADGQPVPESGGYYAPPTRKAYLWRQPTRYYTRCLLLHEAAHQFHYLSSTGNRAIPFGWYVEGIAEHLCRHRWDGETVELGVLPRISLKDYAAAALAEIRAGAEVADPETLEKLSRPLSWALVRFLVTGPYDRKWNGIRKRFDRGAGSAKVLYRSIGSGKRLATKLADWLEAEQEPWEQVYNQWEEIGEGRIRGMAGPGIVSFCRPKAPPQRLAADLEVPEEDDFTGGLLLAFVDRDNYTVALIFGGKAIHVNQRRKGRWHPLLRVDCPPAGDDGLLHLEAAWTDDVVEFQVEGRRIDTFKLRNGALGLALQGGTATYRNVVTE